MSKKKARFMVTVMAGIFLGDGGAGAPVCDGGPLCTGSRNTRGHARAANGTSGWFPWYGPRFASDASLQSFDYLCSLIFFYDIHVVRRKIHNKRGNGGWQVKDGCWGEEQPPLLRPRRERH